jgi:hypothetical protein
MGVGSSVGHKNLNLNSLDFMVQIRELANNNENWKMLNTLYEALFDAKSDQ